MPDGRVLFVDSAVHPAGDGVLSGRESHTFFKRLKQFGYIDSVMIISDLIGRSDYELFKKVCSASHSLYHLLPPYHTTDLHLRRLPFQLPQYYTDLHKNRSLFDLCMNTLNEIGLRL